MAICSGCGSSVKDGLRYCPNCGAQMNVGAAEPEDSVFAAAGITVGGAQQFGAQSYQPQAEPSQPQYRQPSPQQQYQPQYQPQYEKQANVQPAAAPQQEQPKAQSRPQTYEDDSEGTGCYEVYPTIKYMGLVLLQAIPILGFIITVVFAFNGSNHNRRNFCRAILLWWIIAAAASAAIYFVYGEALGSLVDALMNSGVLTDLQGVAAAL